MPTLSRVGEMTSIQLIVPVFNTALLLGRRWMPSYASSSAARGNIISRQRLDGRHRGCGPVLPGSVAEPDDHRRLRHQGASYARNCAVDAARGQKLVFVDGDDVPAEGYIETMSAALDENRLVCSRIDVEQLNPRWTNELPRPPAPRPLGLPVLPAVGRRVDAGSERDLFEGVGGFDESLLYAEDIDFCWRAQLYGGAELVFVPDARAARAPPLEPAPDLLPGQAVELRRVGPVPGLPADGRPVRAAPGPRCCGGGS